ncbi:MAG: alginate lyase family protein [Pseudohongiella sp.]|nr:alginate lyase family protein [Pseudohongiella sp.]
MRLQKLLNMAPAEIVCRSRQAVLKTVERVSYSPVDPVRQVSELFYCLDEDLNDAESPSSLFKHGYQEYATESLQLRFRALAQQRFFPGASDALAPGMISLYLPNLRDEVIKDAETICSGKYYTLGYGWLAFDKDNASGTNWHLDAVSGTVSPFVHWSRIDALNFAQVGDSKVVWELNRHQWLLQLGMAWQFTGDDKYAVVFTQKLRAWMQENPPGFGINWTSSLEVSYRLISWCWALVMFRNSSRVSPFMHLSIMSWLQAHALHIERYLSIYYSPNTHLTGEALGLYYAGVLFPEINGSARWRSLGRKILLEQLGRQVHEDGVYFEQSTNYQYYTVEIYLHFMILSQRNGDELPDSFLDRVQTMLDFLLDMRRPDGTVPAVGDMDGGSLFPVVHRKAGDFSAAFSIAAVLFDRQDYAWAAGSSTPELVCLMGAAGHYALMAMRKKAPLVISSCLYPDGGYLIMRNDRHARGHQMIFDVGPLGCPDSAAHGHADLLAIQCSAFGDNYLVDAGTDNYTADPQWRNYFRSTQAHNTVCVDGLSQAEPVGPFSWQSRRPVVSLRSCWTTPQMSLVDASHDAWSNLPDPVTHRRRIIFVRRRYWVLIDDLCAKQSHKFDLNFQFSPIEISLENESWVRAKGASGSCLMMHISANSKLKYAISSGQENPPRGWISENYGQRIPAPSLSCTTESDKPVRFITILLPLPESAMDAPAVTVRQSESESGSDYIQIDFHDSKSDLIVVSDSDVTMTRGIGLCAE